MDWGGVFNLVVEINPTSATVYILHDLQEAYTMWRVPIVSMECIVPGTGSNGKCRSRFSERPLPVFYMSDYSVVGLKVDQMDDSLRIMEERGYIVQDESWGPEVLLGSPSQLSEIINHLATRGISGQIADLVYGLYQG